MRNSDDLYALPSINYRWRLIDSHWRCINQLTDLSLADFLWVYGFDIPATITYCIAENDKYWLKFRHSGGLIDIFIKPLNIKKQMKKIPHLDVNCIPSQLNTSAPTGVASQLSSVSKNDPSYDGVTIENMRNNPIYDRGDKIDKVGKVQKTITERAKIVKSKTKMIRGLNDYAQKLSKPKNN